MAKSSHKKPDFILTLAKDVPRICPACAHADVARVDSFGIWKLTCQRCGWSEKYQVKP